MRKKAFTLTELLVVMSIVSMLMGILLPSLNQARQQAKSVMCLSNLRQMVTAANIYTNSNDGYYPQAYRNPPRTSNIRADYKWDFCDFRDWSTRPPTPTREPGLLWSTASNPKIHQCPAFKPDKQDPNDPYTGYNYNTSYIGRNETRMDPAVHWNVPAAHMLEVTRPAQTAIFGDGNQMNNDANRFMRAPFPNPRDASFVGRHAGAQGYLHLNKTNVAFCDGHARSWDKIYTKTDDDAGQLEEYNKTAKVKIGFLSEDNSLYDLE